MLAGSMRGTRCGEDRLEGVFRMSGVSVDVDQQRIYALRRRFRRRKRLLAFTQQSTSYIVLAFGAVLIMIPFFWMVSTSLKEWSSLFLYPPQWIPRPVVWRNYVDALTLVPFFTFLKNTCMITFTSLIGQVLSASMVAFSFARLRWPGRDVIFIILLSTLMLPYEVTLIPKFMMFRALGWINTFKPLIVPDYFGGGAFLVFLLRQFYMTIPAELDDAARIDGCSTVGIWWRIMMPLAKPALGIVAIFGFQGHWNDFMGPLIYLNSTEKFTLALGLNLFKNQYTAQYQYIMAASLIVMLPLLVNFYIAQRYFVQGVVITGLKG